MSTYCCTVILLLWLHGLTAPVVKKLFVERQILRLKGPRHSRSGAWVARRTGASGVAIFHGPKIASGRSRIPTGIWKTCLSNEKSFFMILIRHFTSLYKMIQSMESKNVFLKRCFFSSKCWAKMLATQLPLFCHRFGPKIGPFFHRRQTLRHGHEAGEVLGVRGATLGRPRKTSATFGCVLFKASIDIHSIP